MIDVTPDGIPVISGVDSLPGFSIALGASRLIAELVMNDTPVVDLAPFRYSCSLDGTRLKPSPLA